MSEQTNPSNEEETTAVVETATPDTNAVANTPTTATPDASTVERAPESTQQPVPQQPAPQAPRDATRSGAPTPARSFDNKAEYAVDDDDDDDDDEYSDDYNEEDEDLYVDGPAQYVQRERGGRGRRIGNDIRVTDIDYKNVPLLSRFLDRRGRILSRRRTRVSAKVQRRIVKAIKRARHLALLPYTGDHSRIVRKRR